MSGGIGVNILSHFDPKGINKAITDFHRLKTSGEKATFALHKAAIPAAAAFAAVSAAALHALHAAIENEKSQIIFAHAMETATGATAAQVEQINLAIDAMSKQSGISREQLRPAMQYLTIATGSAATAQKDMALAMDISAATGKDLQTVAEALGKAHNGVTRGLIKLDPALKSVLGTTKDFTVIQGILNDTFGGSEAAFEKTAAGGMRVFQNSIHELWVSMGDALLPVFKAVLPFFISLGEWAQTHSKMFVIMAAGVAAFAAAILIANTVLKVMAIWEAIVNAENPFALIVLAVLAVITVVVYLYKRFEIVKTVIDAVVNFIIGAFEFLVNKIIFVANIYIDAINLMIRGANLFGAGLTTLGHIGEVQFGRIGQAAVMSARQMETALAAFRKGEHEVGLSSKQETTPDPTGGAAKTVKTAAEKIKEYITALKSMTDAQKSAHDAGMKVTDAVKAQVAATVKVAAAQKTLNLVLHGYGAASKEAAAQSKVVAQANRDLTKSHESVSDAVRAVRDAEQKLKDLREGVKPRDMQSAEQKLAQTKFGLEQANFNVIDAEKELADLRTKGDATPEEIRKAEIAVAEAKFSVVDATNSITDAETELQNLRLNTPTVDEVAAAERDLFDAKIAVEQAVSDESDATTTLNDAQSLYNELVNGATESSDRYQAALKDLQDAQQEELDALDKVTEAKLAQLDATEKMIEAERELAKVKSEVGGQIVKRAEKQMSGLLSEAQARLPAIGTTSGLLSANTASLAVTQNEVDKAIAEIEANMAGIDFGGFGTLMGDGGIVKSATRATIGESGAEAVIPLDRLSSFGSTNVYVTVNAGMGTDATAVGDEIVNVLARWNRRNGNLPLKVA